MSILRRGERRRGRVGAVLTTVGALVAFQALAMVGAGAAFASGTCTYNPATDTINITIDAGTQSVVQVETAAADIDPAAPPGAILFDGLACGSATNSNTVAIVVLGQPSFDEDFVIDEAAGGTFNPAIVWNVDLGSNTVGGTDRMGFFLNCDQDNTLVLTNSSFDLNGGLGEVLGVEHYFVPGCDGDDTVDASAVTFQVALFGNNGDDVLSPGTFGGDPAVLGSGDTVQGGADDDTLSYGTRTTPVFVANGSEAGLDSNADGDNDDTGEETDSIDCFETVVTGTGNDTIEAFCGPTIVVPGDGDDFIDGNGDDTIDWSTSSTGMVIDTTNESATGQGTDTWDGVDDFIGSEFDDTLLVTDGAPGGDVDSFSGLGGVDTVDASAATEGQFLSLDILDPSGGSEADDLENIIGSPFGDFVDGNDLANNLRGGGGDDDIEGDNGNDTLLGEGGNDVFFGGTGADTVSFATNAAEGVNVDLSLGFATSAESGSDSFDDLVEIIVGSDFNDTITGGPFGGGGTVNFLFKGRAGRDVLTGFVGNDTLRGGGGRDTIRGSAGDDTLVGNKGNDTLAGGAGFDIGKGGKGRDVCRGVEQRTSCGTRNNPAVSGLAARLA